MLNEFKRDAFDDNHCVDNDDETTTIFLLIFIFVFHNDWMKTADIA